MCRMLKRLFEEMSPIYAARTAFLRSVSQDQIDFRVRRVLAKKTTVPSWFSGIDWEKTMLVFLTPAPRPDAPEWSGRRWLDEVDAVSWPAAWALGAAMVPAASVGVVGPVVIAFAAWSALSRVHRALWQNHRYWFTTWRWGKLAAALLLVGMVLKIAIAR